MLLPLTAPELKRVKADAELARARENLEAAKKAREDGKDPTPEETQWLGKKGGGARPVPTEAYRRPHQGTRRRGEGRRGRVRARPQGRPDGRH